MVFGYSVLRSSFLPIEFHFIFIVFTGFSRKITRLPGCLAHFNLKRIHKTLGSIRALVLPTDRYIFLSVCLHLIHFLQLLRCLFCVPSSYCIFTKWTKKGRTKKTLDPHLLSLNESLFWISLFPPTIEAVRTQLICGFSLCFQSFFCIFSLFSPLYNP